MLLKFSVLLKLTDDKHIEKYVTVKFVEEVWQLYFSLKLLYGHNIMQGIQRLEMGKRLFIKYLMEENSNQNKRKKYKPETDKNGEHSRSHSDMLDEKVLIPHLLSPPFLYI